tara:strand:- start:497 stop:1234 length:738 start_codon:yes stop_codon:yes gene_type:complete
VVSVYPKSLKNDAIAEALVEIRFQSDEMPEVVLGRLADSDALRGFDRVRTGIADIPAPIRESDPNLKYSPVFEYRSKDGTEVYKFNHNMIAFHNPKKYLGWEGFLKKVTLMVDTVFSRLGNVVVQRVGLRYINFLDSSHYIKTIQDLNVSVAVLGNEIDTDFNLNFSDKLSDSCDALIKIATPNFVQGPRPENAVAFFDIDVFTKRGFTAKNKKDCLKWIEEGHDKEKSLFFDMLPKTAIEKLAE